MSRAKTAKKEKMKSNKSNFKKDAPLTSRRTKRKIGLDKKIKSPKEKPPSTTKIEKKINDLLYNCSLNDIIVQAPVVSEIVPAKDILAQIETDKIILVSKENKILGSITMQSIVNNIRDPIELLVASDLMEKVNGLDYKKSIMEALLEMRKKNTGHLLITREDNVLGIVTSEKIIQLINHQMAQQGFENSQTIETKIDEFLDLLKKGPISLKDAQKKLGVEYDQIDNWITVLEHQKIIKIEKHFGILRIKDERKI